MSRMMIISLILISGLVSAADYYVSNSGNDANNGCCDPSAGVSDCQGCSGTDGPWNSIDKVNSMDLKSGDAIYLKRGDIFSDSTMQFSGVTGEGKELSIGSYHQGEKPIFDANVRQPIRITNAAIETLNIENIQVHGMDWNHWNDPWPSGYGIAYFNNIKNIVIDGFDFYGHEGTTVFRHKEFVIAVDDPKPGSTIEIKNCHMQDLRPDDNPNEWDGSGGYDEDWDGLQDANFIHIDRKQNVGLWLEGRLSIHDNEFSGVWSDCIIVTDVQVPDNEIYNNKFSAYGENGIDVKANRFLKIFNNEFTRDGYGYGGYPIGGGLGDIVTHDDGYSEPRHASDLEIYNNYFHDTDSIGIRMIGHTKDSKIHHNYMERMGCLGIQASGSLSDGNDIYSNVISMDGTHDSDVGVCFRSGIYVYGNDLDDTRIFGNTIFTGTQVYGLIYFTHPDATGNQIINNAFIVDSPNPISYPLYMVGKGNDPEISNNLYFSSAGENRICYQASSAFSECSGGTAYQDSNFGTCTALHPDELSTEPELEENALWPSASSPMVGNGMDLGELYKMQIDPAHTDFTANPPEVVMTEQPTSWTLGAYALPGSSSCTDADGDGYGIGCAGPDCDDSDDSVHAEISCSYDGSTCGAFKLCVTSCPVPPSEDCGTTGDEDCDGLADCADNDCAAHCSESHEFISYKSNAVNIDGVLETSWSDPVSFTNPSRSDNAVQAYGLWDDDYLYFAFDVSDAELEAVDGNDWEDDGAEIMLDVLHDATTSLNSDDRHYIVTINGMRTSGILYAKKDTADGYVMETAIPWSMLGTTPDYGKSMGLLLGNNDRDDGISSQFDWLGLIDSGNYARPNLWGDMILLHRADDDRDGCVDMGEIIAYIGAWKNGYVNLGDLIDAVNLWKQCD